jgi:mannitol/fructose-specific phosphotransferase system IIA component
MTSGELEAEQATELPDREAMSIIAIGDNVAVPINESTAINYASNYSVAVADADQVVIVDQTDVDPDPSTDPADTTEDSRPRGWRGGRNG